jgi:hypothetical protein
MSKENQAELFIRLLIEAFESDLMMRKLGLSVRSPDQSNRFKALCMLDLELAKEELEPLDSLQLMHTDRPDRAPLEYRSA